MRFLKEAPLLLVFTHVLVEGCVHQRMAQVFPSSYSMVHACAYLQDKKKDKKKKAAEAEVAAAAPVVEEPAANGVESEKKKKVRRKIIRTP